MRLFRILHKWLGLIVGLQLLLWMMSGLVFAWLGHEDVSAEHSLRERPKLVLAQNAPLFEPDALLEAYGDQEILDVTLMPLHDDWVYRVRHVDRVELRRADDGSGIVIGEAVVRGLAAAHYAGAGAPQSVSFHTMPTLEVRDAGAVWEAAYEDPDRTSLYFSAEDGRLAAARNRTWRIFDFFWMLHTMDYRGRDDFNNPLVILFSTGALWLGISGALLLIRAFGRGQ